TLQPKFLVEKFAEQNNSLLELKTKTTNIESLLNIDHNGKTVIAWSLNTPDVISSEERGTASLISRLKAAKRVEAKGYKLAFHFDPMVIYYGCKEQYKKVIHKIFEYVHPENIVWISIGSFRFMPKLKQVIEKRFKNSTICYGEFILGLDNKMRYFKPLRIKLYKTIIDTIKEYDPNILVYFCMEDEEVWKKSFGFFPKREGELGNLLDKSAVKHCGLNSSFL
ncbi:MAG: spore photoproduct lyase family protein, partial [Thermodesulfobacteriota bacterium]